MSPARAFHWLMAVLAFVLPSLPLSAERPDALSDSAVERPTSKDTVFRHYL